MGAVGVRVSDAPDLPLTAPPAPRHHREQRRPRLLAELPDLLVTVLLAVSLVMSLGLVARAHHPVATTAIGVVLGWVLWRAVRDRRALPAPAEDPAAAAAALLVVSMLLVPSIALAGEHVFVRRDPGFYTVTAKWLTTHSSPFITSEAARFGSAEVQNYAAGFTDTGTGWWPQGSHLVPALVSVPGLAGDEMLLAGNAFIGGVALLSVYGLARRLVGPWWGMLPMIVIGLSMPWMAFTRMAYSEPVTVAFGFASLTFLERAWRTGSRAALAVAGALAGAPSLARIDGGLNLVTLVPVVAAVAFFSPGPRSSGLRSFLAFLAPGVATFALGWLELRRNSPDYLDDLGPQMTLLSGLLVVSLASSVAVAKLAHATGVRNRMRTARPRVALVASGLVLLAGLVLALRPLVWVSRSLAPLGTQYTDAVAALQQREGSAIDPTRGYDESTFTWLAWYLGWPAVVLGVAGLAWAAWTAVQRRNRVLGAFVVMVGGVSMLYLNRISITPDQVWASRRLLPVVLPGFAIASALAIHAVSRGGAGRRWLAYGAAAVVAVAPAIPGKALYGQPDYKGQLAELTDVCDAIPPDGRVLLPDAGLRFTAVVTVRVWCDVPASGVPAGDTAALAQAARAVDGPLFVLVSDPRVVTWQVPPAPFLTARVTRWEERLGGTPRETIDVDHVLYLGLVSSDGTVAPVS